MILARDKNMSIRHIPQNIQRLPGGGLTYVGRRVDWNKRTHRDKDKNPLPDPCPNNKIGFGEIKMCGSATESTGKDYMSFSSSRSTSVNICPICEMERRSDWRYTGQRFVTNITEAGDPPSWS